ncbi:hypothetical protein SEA_GUILLSMINGER_94 [Mycobacterium phage Guillsminger]|nr:hypothetical protein SEA_GUILLSMINGER_94 [Mycobacterium phage Guillsminger]
MAGHPQAPLTNTRDTSSDTAAGNTLTHPPGQHGGKWGCQPGGALGDT